MLLFIFSTGYIHDLNIIIFKYKMATKTRDLILYIRIIPLK